MKKVAIVIIMVCIMACGKTSEKAFQEITASQLQQELAIKLKAGCIWRYKSDKFYYYFSNICVPSDQEVTVFSPIKIIKKFKVKKEFLLLPESKNFTLLKQFVNIYRSDL